MIKIQNVMVATDFSEPSQTALEYAKAIATIHQARLHVVHVVDVAPTDSGFLTATTLAAMRGEAESFAQKKFAEVLSPAETAQLSATLEIIPGSPYPEIIGYAEKNSIDLIVMGTNGRGRLAQLFVGSVAERVVRDAPCPVLTVHADHKGSLAK